MTVMKDFYGNNVAEAISVACAELALSREELEIEVLETGSAGIFGLCKKKAHIRVARKKTAAAAVVTAEEKNEKSTLAPKAPAPEPVVVNEQRQQVATPRVAPPAKEDMAAEEPPAEERGEETEEDEDDYSLPRSAARGEDGSAEPRELIMPAPEVIESIRTDLAEMLCLMGFTVEVSITTEEYMLRCLVTGRDAREVVGEEGRTLDSLQYLLRKMVNQRLPERMPLLLDAGDFRERRISELREKALSLAEQVKNSGKTQAIAALNPSERRVIHMALQDDKGVRSRSVGEGLFKKVLIYKPGKVRNKPQPARKKRSHQGGNNGDQ